MSMVLAASATGAVAAAAEHAEHKGGLPQLNINDFAPQLFWLVIAFCLLYLLLSRVALPRIGEVIDERRNRIDRDLQEAERLRSETEKSMASYEQALAEARAKAQGIVGEQRIKLTAEMNTERAKVEQSIAERTAAAEKQVEQLKTAALAQVNTIAAEAVGAIVAKLIGVEPQKGEIDEALAKLPR
jgi:F-type H+-transporting ATPase subunit b